MDALRVGTPPADYESASVVAGWPASTRQMLALTEFKVRALVSLLLVRLLLCHLASVPCRRCVDSIALTEHVAVPGQVGDLALFLNWKHPGMLAFHVRVRGLRPVA